MTKQNQGAACLMTISPCWLNDDKAQVAHINLGKYRRHISPVKASSTAAAEAALVWGGGLIEFQGPSYPTSATGFIEINYSLRPHTHGSEIAAILA